MKVNEALPAGSTATSSKNKGIKEQPKHTSLAAAAAHRKGCDDDDGVAKRRVPRAQESAADWINFKERRINKWNWSLCSLLLSISTSQSAPFFVFRTNLRPRSPFFWPLRVCWAGCARVKIIYTEPAPEVQIISAAQSTADGNELLCATFSWLRLTNSPSDFPLQMRKKLVMRPFEDRSTSGGILIEFGDVNQTLL